MPNRSSAAVERNLTRARKPFNTMKPFQKVLVPIDFSEHSERVLQTAAELCRHYEAPVTLLHVQESELFSVPESYKLYDPRQLPAMQAKCMASLEAARQKLCAAGAMQVNVALSEGKPARAIVRFAQDGAFDLIVMGTHGRRGISHALLGSVAEEVVRRASCAVTTVRLDGEHGNEINSR